MATENEEILNIELINHFIFLVVHTTKDANDEDYEYVEDAYEVLRIKTYPTHEVHSKEFSTYESAVKEFHAWLYLTSTTY